MHGAINHKSIRRKYPNIFTRRAVTEKLRRKAKAKRNKRTRSHVGLAATSQPAAAKQHKENGAPGTMNSDFYDAHNRHWQDAEQLFEAERWANADQLFGMAAECGLKKLMLVFGMPFDLNRDRPQERQDREHADGIWARYETYRSGHHQGANYGLAANDPFQNWHVSQRYANQCHFNQAWVESHRDGAKEVRKLIRKAQMEGLI